VELAQTHLKLQARADEVRALLAEAHLVGVARRDLEQLRLRRAKVGGATREGGRLG
jgi:hypothetical protein